MSPDGTLPESPHPLLAALLAAATPAARILLLGIGSGRHVPPLLAAGCTVDVVEDDPQRAADAAQLWAGTSGVRVARARYGAFPIPFAGGFEGALSTHALLHGTPALIAQTLQSVARRMRSGAPFYFTLGSTHDARFGRGTRFDDWTWAPSEGSERGVAHAYFDEPRARALLDGWCIEDLQERDAAETIGRWAHEPTERTGTMHWFVRTRAK